MKHQSAVALMKFLSSVARRLGVAESIYIVGGAVRNFVMDSTGQQHPIKDLDIVVDSIGLKGKDSEWFAKQLQRAIPEETKLVTNVYGVAILHIVGDWMLAGHSLKGEAIEIANARKESYGGGGYKPDKIEPSDIPSDALRRDYTMNTLMWRLQDVASGPDLVSILDISGCGLKDLAEGNLKCPRDPDIVFADDPTRMIRAVRFAVKYGFKIPPDMEASIRRNASRLKQIPSSALSNILIKVLSE